MNYYQASRYRACGDRLLDRIATTSRSRDFGFAIEVTGIAAAQS